MEKKKSAFLPKPIGVLCVIIAVALALILAASFGIPRISAHTRLSENLAGFEGISDDDVILVSNPMASGGLEPEKASEILTGEKAYAMASAVLKVTEGASWSESRDIVTGAWDLNLSMRSGEEEFRIYFTSDSFYVVKNYKAYVFEPDSSLADEYTDFYSRLEAIFA